MKIGYDRILTKEVQQTYSRAGTIKNYTRPETLQTDIECFEHFLLCHETHEIIINNLDSIGSFSLVQLHNTLNIIEEKKIKITILKPAIARVAIQGNFLELLRSIVSFEKKAIVKRTTEGLSLAKNKGVIGGRPKLSKDLQDRLYFLHSSKKMPIKDIATELHISVGTVYSYINKKKHQIE